MPVFLVLPLLLGTARADLLPPIRPLQWDVEVDNEESGNRFVAMVRSTDDTPVSIEVFDGTDWHEAEEVFRIGRDAVVRANLNDEVDQIRLSSPDMDRIESLDWDLVSPGLEPIGAPPPSPGVLPSELEEIGVIPRADWGAASTTCVSLEDDWYRMAIHHTAGNQTSGGSVQGTVQALQAYAMSGEYCDVPYQFLIGYDGSLWEGRPYDYYSGATGGGHNDGNIAISFLGCYDSTQCTVGPHAVTQAMLDSAHLLIQTLVELEGVNSDRETIRGHQEWPDNYTACPGDWILDELDGMVEPLSPDYSASLSEASFPFASETSIYLEEGESLTGYFRFENTGRSTWTSATRLAPVPRDTESPIRGDDWISETRVTTAGEQPAPGETGTFGFSIRGNQVGEFTQEFGLLEETVTWFEDDGGIQAADLTLHVIVTASETPESDTGFGIDTGDSVSADTDDTAGWDSAIAPPSNETEEEARGGCACSSRTAANGSYGAGILGLLLLGMVRRRQSTVIRLNRR